ncbi:mitochondrial import inner membrane translocase subunit tim54 [Malassezia vespertilionis]|uniref:Mitochondrial import inner membrane translocase subunit TIM54 n=1 Tax=Malassezia vespertilionis TaxID=2020962 RepID=A0A2N1JFC3_9BASI|nr:mitochondrial import inner membrane translocase subunit tim54 [Malassezia vespertilionis]PKI85248.1 Tim54p [Malassezia vespertilionis]WFD05622.1 mitochondrial import inner membrane translocase subunit tim54 [Malassezia vespertilionis]
MSEVKEASGATPPRPRQIPAALRPLHWMGIPQGVLTWQPKLPSRNWTIFWTCLGSFTFLYYYDRKECRRIRAEYVERVRGLSEEVMQPSELPRRVQVYTAKYPGDDDYEAGVQYFKRYVKPVLVGAAVDYEIVSGTRLGGLARDLRDRIHSRRRNLAGVQPWDNKLGAAALPFSLTPAQALQRELDGAVVLIGRPALKEWAWALKEGWGTFIPAEPIDRDQQLAELLSEDNAFDEIFKEDVDNADAEVPLEKPAAPSQGFMLPSKVAFQGAKRSLPMGVPDAATSQSPVPEGTTPAPAPELPPMLPMPAQPPICFVDFTDLVGFRNIPRTMVNFFNRRKEVRNGGEAGLAIVLGNKNDAREFDVRPRGTVPSEPLQGGDLDWGVEEEAFYRPKFHRTLEIIAKERERYYNVLREELSASRELARGEREPTRSEKYERPRGEVELRQDRFQHERDWRNTEMGYEIAKTGVGVAWDDQWRGSLRVLRPRGPDESVPRKKYPDAPAEEQR